MHIGFDIGGSRVKVAWRSPKSGRLSFRSVSSDLIADPEGWFARLQEGLPAAGRTALESGRLKGVGIGVAGEVRDPGVVVQSPNLPRWKDVSVGPALSHQLGVPVQVENDAHMAAVGLLARPDLAGGEATNVFVFTLGTGVGGAWLLDGALYRRAEGGEAEIGHCPVEPGGRECACGRRGCLEAYAGARAMMEIYRERTGTTLDTMQDLVARAEAGDGTARAVLNDAGAKLGIACAWIANVGSTTRFVFGGGVANARAWLLPALRRSYQDHQFAKATRRAHFRFPSRRSNLGVVGAIHAAELGSRYRLACGPAEKGATG